ncbi:TPA: hypothetical protein L6A41_35625 [Pseudomonas aeruginosa]|uniref:Uncharacterized protein n=1 Tax=Pseudomonas citronellolis TaxID=53408 RepID=A0A1A9KMT3_9PSED|nr:hypothetical protein A9C11_32555 [Pseudomonas citronellolis]ANP63034.1 hypothetical protein A9P90_29605 [Pseudomonas aeruginosa]KWR85221.1 hypothetical protein RN02_02875 [Pseudomonas sp. PI1]KSD71183.1 hypothetical protein AO903_16310 [Pseudomonas aeruginosa]KSG10332.1 hypothetical protein AO943_24060 [Pseudomonas aeruginosa]
MLKIFFVVGLNTRLQILQLLWREMIDLSLRLWGLAGAGDAPARANVDGISEVAAIHLVGQALQIELLIR